METLAALAALHQRLPEAAAELTAVMFVDGAVEHVTHRGRALCSALASSSAELVSVPALTLLEPGLRVCPACVREDLEDADALELLGVNEDCLGAGEAVLTLTDVGDDGIEDAAWLLLLERELRAALQRADALEAASMLAGVRRTIDEVVTRRAALSSRLAPQHLLDEALWIALVAADPVELASTALMSLNALRVPVSHDIELVTALLSALRTVRTFATLEHTLVQAVRTQLGTSAELEAWARSVAASWRATIEAWRDAITGPTGPGALVDLELVASNSTWLPREVAALHGRVAPNGRLVLLAPPLVALWASAQHRVGHRALSSIVAELSEDDSEAVLDTALHLWAPLEEGSSFVSLTSALHAARTLT